MSDRPDDPSAAPDCGRIRLDKWLWHARFFKTRTLAGKMVREGRVRLNGARMAKPAQFVGAGDALTFPQGDRIRVVELLAPGTRRGPASEAQALFRDDTPPPVPRVGPRPTGRDRRRLTELRGGGSPFE